MDLFRLSLVQPTWMHGSKPDETEPRAPRPPNSKVKWPTVRLRIGLDCCRFFSPLASDRSCDVLPISSNWLFSIRKLLVDAS